ncbi:MAG: amidohydrolase, partial [Actinobacteria bacterium]|nr:amidohydrolase [Actinomycetota bacterium]
DIVDKFGAEKILFGTPNCEISSGLSGAVISMLNYSGIISEAKTKIAGQNLISVLNKKKKAKSKLNKFNKIINIPGSKTEDTGIKKSFKGFPFDDFILSAYKGSLLPCPVIDCHYHAGEFASEYKPGSGIDTIRALLEREDIEGLFITSSEAVFGGDHCTGNKYVYDLCKKYPELITGFYVFNPNFSESYNEMEKYLSGMNFKGIKIHPRIHKCDINDKKYLPVWEAAKKFKVPVLSHTGEGQAHSDPEYFYEISKKYHEVTFILGHGGESFKGILQSIDIVNSRNNVYIDISGWGFMHKGVLEFVAAKVGAEKLLFGSDAGWIDFNYAVGVVVFSRLSQPEKEKILYQNARKILKK